VLALLGDCSHSSCCCSTVSLSLWWSRQGTLGTVLDVEWTCDDQHILGAGSDKALRLWDAGTGENSAAIPNPSETRLCAFLFTFVIHLAKVFDEDDNFPLAAFFLAVTIATVVTDATSSVTGRVRHTLTGHTDKARLLCDIGLTGNLHSLSHLSLVSSEMRFFLY